MGSDHVQLRNEIRVSLFETDLLDLKTNFSWLCKRTYLTHILKYLNDLNLSLQRNYIDGFRVDKKIEFTKK